MRECPAEFLACAHPLRVGIFLHYRVEHPQRVGLAQLVQLHSHGSLQGLVVEVVVGESEVAQVVAAEAAVAVGIADVECQPLLPLLAVGIQHEHVCCVYVVFVFVCLSSLGRESELEQSVAVHLEAVEERVFVGYRVGLEGVPHLLARHFPFHPRSGHRCAAIACRCAIDGYGLAKASDGICCAVGICCGGGKCHRKTGRFVGTYRNRAAVCV